MLVYGASFTAILAGIYLYIFGALEERARIVNDVAPLREAKLQSRDEWEPKAQLRDALSERLELGSDSKKNLEGLVAILSPLIGALLSRLAGV
jgi:hypothetical protein